MSTFTLEAKAQKVWFDDDNMWIMFTDGRQLSIPLTYFPRLKRASEDLRNRYEISGGGTGLHWDEIDEDISVPNLLMGYYDRKAT
jgi:hypothetical protein